MADNWIALEAKQELARRAVSVAKAHGCSAEDARKYVCELYPDLATRANDGRAFVEKSAGAYARIEDLARSRVEKSGHAESFDQAVAAVLKSAEGKALYAAYHTELQVGWAKSGLSL